MSWGSIKQSRHSRGPWAQRCQHCGIFNLVLVVSRSADGFVIQNSWFYNVGTQMLPDQTALTLSTFDPHTFDWNKPWTASHKYAHFYPKGELYFLLYDFFLLFTDWFTVYRHTWLHILRSANLLIAERWILMLLLMLDCCQLTESDTYCPSHANLNQKGGLANYRHT